MSVFSDIILSFEELKDGECISFGMHINEVHMIETMSQFLSFGLRFDFVKSRKI